jgi:two-component system response regulator RstA
MISDYLATHGYQVDTCHRGDDAINVILETAPDLVVLDLMLPGTDGLSVCREVRSQYTGKILMLTALDDTVEEITGLETGADDYLTKPVSPRLLLARVRLQLRKPESAQLIEKESITLGSLTVDRENREVTCEGSAVRLTTTEFDLLWILATSAGKPISRESLHECMFRLEQTPEDRRIDLIISRIRKKLGDSSANPQYVKTIRGQGYLLGTGR